MSQPAPVSRQHWPAHLDALIAAPQHHTLMFENELVRVLETKVPPGETTAVHTHGWPATLYVVSPGDFVRRDDNGNVLLDTRVTGAKGKAGDAAWSPPMGPHTLENVGTTLIHVINVEVKMVT
jgi:quercetin dioxygenase-like cupin family protein